MKFKNIFKFVSYGVIFSMNFTDLLHILKQITENKFISKLSFISGRKYVAKDLILL